MARAKASSPGYLVIDIETVRDYALWSPPEDNVDAMPPTFACIVVCIGVAWLDDQYGLKQYGTIIAPTEAELLQLFQKFVAKHRPTVVTYNGRGFDLPVIAQRSMRHGVAMSWFYSGKGSSSPGYRYSDTGHMDLCDEISMHGAARMVKLDELSRMIGLPGKGATAGSDVAKLHAEGRTREIEAYCMTDVIQTALLLLRYRQLQGRVSAKQYQQAVALIVEKAHADERLRAMAGAINAPMLMHCEGT